MITRIEALNYRCLQYVSQDVKNFEVLIGPNASGKTTFLDVIAFLGTMVRDGIEAALDERTNNHKELLFKKEGNQFELAIELEMPPEIRKHINRKELTTLRYEVAVGYDEERTNFVIRQEKVFLKKTNIFAKSEFDLFPYDFCPPDTIMTRKGIPGTQRLVSKELHGNDNFSSAKDRKANKGWMPSFRFGNLKSALANLPADEERFPVSTWLKNFLINGVQNFILNSLALRKASPYAKQRGFELDGSNLPWVVQRLKNESPERFKLWIEHLQTALPELKNIKTIERPDDKHCYLVYEYSLGFAVPSWCASDGTLRLTALTLPAYLSDSTGVFLIEEPENGIHPNAIETVIDSLSSVYGGQVFLASHSPVVLSKISPESVLCFSKNKAGATTIVRGDRHPYLKSWQGNIDFKTLFASGVLG